MKVFSRYGVIAALAWVLSGCATSPSFLYSNSMISGHEAALYRDILVEAASIFVLVTGLMIWILIRDRNRSGDRALPPQIYGRVAWAAIPVLVILALDSMDFTWMTQTMRAVAAPPSAASDVNIHVIGHRWWWEFDYPDLGIKTANELHIPVGSTVQVTLDSVDVIHSFWLPQLSGKTDVIPGHTNHMWLTADQTGVFLGQCAEFCGTEHAMMRIHVMVDSQEDFKAWVAHQQKPAPQPQTADEQAGYKIITSTCSTCHSLDETEAAAKTGPNLNHLFSRSVFAGATFDLTEENMRRWLQDTQAMKPDNDMNIKLKPDEINQIIAYLKLLK